MPRIPGSLATLVAALSAVLLTTTAPASAADAVDLELQVVRYRAVRVRRVSRRVAEVNVSVRVSNARNAKYAQVGGVFTPTTLLPVTPVSTLVHFPNVDPRAAVTATDTIVVQMPKAKLRRFKQMLRNRTAFAPDMLATEVPIAKGTLRLIDPATCAVFASVDTTTPVVPAGAYTYVFGDTPFLRALRAGDVVITDECKSCVPDLPIRVESVSFQGQSATIIGTPLTAIVDLWENATFKVARTVFLQSAGPNFTGGVTSRIADECDDDPGGLGSGNYSVDTPTGFFFPVNDVEVAPGATLSGDFAIGAADFGLEIRIRDGVLERAGVRTDIFQHLTLELRAEADVEIHRVERPLLSDFALPGFHTNIGGFPVSIQPTMSIYVGAEGSITAGTVAGGIQSSTAHFSAGVLNGQADPEVSFDVLPLALTPPQLTGDTGMTARLFGGVEVAVQIEHVGGPTMNVEASIDLAVDPNATEWWDLSVGARATAGMQFAPFGIDIAEADYPVLDTRHGGLVAAVAGKRPGARAGSARVVSARASGQAQRWAKSIDLMANSDDFAADVIVTTDGSIVSVGSAAFDGFAMKHDTAGGELFVRRLGNVSGVAPQAVVEVPGTGYLVAGELGPLAFAAMLDPDGTVRWKNHYDFGGTFDDLGLDRIVDPATGDVTGFVFAGSLLIEATFRTVVVRLDTAGNVVWAKIYALRGWEQFFDVKSLPDGGFIACGYLSTPVPTVDEPGNQTGWVVRLDADGGVVWSRGVGSSAAGEYLRAVIPFGEDFVAVGNTGTSALSPHETLFVARLASNGDEVHLTTYAGPPIFTEPGAPVVLGDTGFDTAYDVIRQPYGVTIVGKTDNAFASSAWLIRLDEDLDPVWWLTADGTGIDEFRAVADTGDGYVALGNTTSFTGQPSRNFLLARVPYDGQLHFSPAGTGWTNYSSPIVTPLGGALLVGGVPITEGSVEVTPVVSDVAIIVSTADWSVFDVAVDSTTELVQR